MLNVSDLNVHYGAIHAIKGISFNVKKGEIVSLIGANGAGKTTVLHTISGLIKATMGECTYKDVSLKNIPAHKIPYMGLVHVPEGRHIFASMTVAENLWLGAYSVKDKNFIKNEYERVLELFPRLKERLKQQAGTLSGGEQQMLAMGRALMAKPETILLDEPSMGLSPILVIEIFNIIKECNNAGITILLVEQNAKMALSISDRAYVMETGKIIMSGEASSLLGDENVKKAYLGG